MSKRPTAALGIVIAAVAGAVYANALFNGFALDDVFIIQRNARVHDLANLREIWLTPYWPVGGRALGLYRPTAIFLYALEWAIGGGAAWVFHAVNILLHAFASVLVFVFLGRLRLGNVAAFGGAVIFAVHPVHTEAVANIVGQAEIVAAIAVLSACLIHAARPAGSAVSWPRRLLLVVLFLIALSSKESAVVLPGLLVITDLAQKRIQLTVNGLARYADAMLMPVLLMALALAAYLLVRFDVMGGSLIGVDAAPAMPYLREEHRVLNALRAFPEFIRLLFFPQELAADYLPAVIMPVEEVRPMVILGATLLTGFTAMALLTPWFPGVGFPAAWFLLTIITVSNLFFPIGVLVAERTLYLPSIALSAALAFAWRAAAPAASRRTRTFAAATLLVVIALMAIRTWIRNPDWKDNPALYRALVRDHPHAYRAQWVQAAGLRLQGDVDLADAHYRMAYRIYPRDAQLMAEYANFLLENGRTVEAVEMLEQSFAIHPDVQTTVIMLAQAYLATNRIEDALDMIRAADRLGAGQAALALRAYAYHALGRHDLAVGAARAASRYPRMSWRVWSYLARNLAVGGFTDEALTYADKAGNLAPDPESKSLVDRVAAAIRAGCYDMPAYGSTAAPSCDPLGTTFVIGDAAQNASDLQNAREEGATTPPQDPGDLP